MIRGLAIALVALVIVAAPASAAGLTGKYVEVRTCDVWTGPCFANAEMNFTGKQAVLGWKIDKGTVNDVRLDGLGVVAVVVASDTLGMDQTGPARAILIVDKKADKAQREALIDLAKKQGGELTKNILAVESAAIELSACECKDGACFVLNAGAAHLQTRCLDGAHDKICGNESAFYPPLVKNVSVKAAIAVEHGFQGKGFNETWKEANRRGAYVGSFEIK
jgi:hypothetical protein